MIRRCLFILFLVLFSSILSPQPIRLVYAVEEEQELFFVAQKAFEDGFYDVSIRYINQFLERFPQSQRKVESKILLGQCYFFKQHYLRAYDVFASLKGSKTNQDAVLFWLGETFSKNNEIKKAREQYQELVDVFESSLYRPQAIYSLAWLSFENQRYQEARLYFEKILNEYPQHHLSEDAYIKIAESFYNEGEYELAIDHFKKYIEHYVKSDRAGEVYFNIAEAYYALEEYEPAIEYYRRLKSKNIDKRMLLSAQISQGWGFMKLGELDQAQIVLDEAEIFAQENNMPLEEVLIAQASFYTDTENYTDAIDTFNQLIEDYPESARIADAYLGRANIYYMKEQFSEAIKDYQFVSEQFSGLDMYGEVVEKARFGLAWTHLKAGDIDGAINNFEGVLEKAGNDVVKVSALTQIGDAYQEVSELEKAVEVYDRILKDFPESPYADYVQYRQGVALLKLNRYDAALLSFGSLKANFPDSRYNNDVDYYLGATYFQKKDWGGAKEILLKFLKNVVRENEFAGEANYILGLSYFNLNEFKSALDVFDNMQRHFSDDLLLIANVDISKAKVLYEMGKKDQAIKSFSQIAEKYNDGDAPEEALIWLGDHFANESDLNKALAYYKRFIKLFPKSKRVPSVNYEIGRIYELLQEWDEAISSYRLVSNADIATDLQAQAKLAIGDIFSRQFNPDDAEEIYRSIIKKNPEYKRNALMNLAELSKKKNDFKNAVAYYFKALKEEAGESNISQAEVYFALGDVYEIMNEPEKAIEHYLKIPYLSKRKLAWVVKAYLRVGRLFENQEKWNEAKTIYEKLIDMEIDESKYARERIQWIDENSI